MNESERKKNIEKYELVMNSIHKSNAKKQRIEENSNKANKSTIKTNKFNKVVGILNLIFVIIGVLLTAILLYLTIKNWKIKL